MLIVRQPRVNRGVERMLIEGINQHLTADAFNTHDPKTLDSHSTSLHLGV